MKKRTIVWILTAVITLFSVIYQRMTGPTNPLKGVVQLNSHSINYQLPRSHAGEGDQIVRIFTPDSSLSTLYYRYYPGSGPFISLPMTREGDHATGVLPNQPPAGKLEYYIVLNDSDSSIKIPDQDNNAIIRFRGDVPPFILIPHIIFMFMAMLTSNRILCSLFEPYQEKIIHQWIIITVILMGAGGLIFGPIVQKYAFGQFWTGFPMGHDLTDNKVAVSFLIWLYPFYQSLRKRNAWRWALIASIVMLIIFLIPHSLWGSELKLSTQSL